MHEDFISTADIIDMPTLVKNVNQSGELVIRKVFNELLDVAGITDPASTSLETFVEKSYHANDSLLREFFEMLEIRFCNTCHHAFVDGYMDSYDYYCEKPGCLPYTDERWEELCDEYEDECYWSQWEGSDVLVDLYNKVAFGDKEVE